MNIFRSFHGFFLVLFLLPSGLLRAETTWTVYEDFSGRLAKRWPYGQGMGAVIDGGRVKVDAADGVVTRTSNARFDQRSIRFEDFQELAGRNWAIGLVTPDGQNRLTLQRDAVDSPNLFFYVVKDGKSIIKEDAGPLAKGSSLDLTLDWQGDHYQAEVKNNGKVVLSKSIPAEDAAKDMFARFGGYAGAVFTLKQIEAGPEPKRDKPARPFHPILGANALPMGYIPSPWAKSKVPPTLEALRKLRPAGLPSHPMAQWVADRMARDTGKTPEIAAIETALKGFARQGNFWVRNDESGLWISNGKVGYALLPANQGAAIASLYSLETGTECIFKAPQPSVPWKLRMWKNWPPGTKAPISSIYVNEGDKSYFLETSDAPLEAQFQPEIAGDEAKLNITWKPVQPVNGTDQYQVSATIVMNAGLPLVHWRAKTNRTDGSSETLIGLQFPVVRGLSAPKESDLMLAWGQGRGHFYRASEGWGNGYFTYPHHGWSIPFFSISFGPDAALYLACHDGAANFKEGTFAPGGASHIETTATQADKVEMNYDVVMGPIKGDWYDAAQMYRQWGIQQKWCAKGTLWDRAQKGTVDKALAEVDYWIRPNWEDWKDPDGGSMVWWPTWLKDEDAPRNGPEEVWANVDWFWHGKLPRFTQDAATANITPGEPPRKPGIGVWWYGWEKQGFDTETPIFDARPGVPEEFKKEVEAGLVLTPYIDIQWWDTEEPTFDTAAKAAATKMIDGKMAVGLFAAPMAIMCFSQKLVGDTMAKVIANVHAWGANGVYLDTMPGAGYCWDPSHGHTPGPGGHWDTDDQRQDLERVKTEQGQQFGVTTEHKSEPMMDGVDAEMSYGPIDPDDAPAWPAIYGGYTVISGATTHPKGPDDIISFRLKLGRAFIWGSQLGRGCFSSPLLEKDKAVFLRKLIWLRAQAHPFMPYGAMLRPPPLLGDMPRVHGSKWVDEGTGFVVDYDAYEAALWQAPNGDLGLVAVNFDDKPHTLSFPAKQVFGEEERTASLLTADGEKPLRTVKASEKVTLELPPADALMVVFKK